MDNFFGFRGDGLRGDEHGLTNTGGVEKGKLEGREVVKRRLGFGNGEGVYDLDFAAGEIGDWEEELG